MKRTKIEINRGLICETGVIPTGMQLIQSSFPIRVDQIQKVLREDAYGQNYPVMIVTGLFQESDLENANGRVYPYDVLKLATNNILEDVSARAVYGEYDHPDTAKVHLDRISHLVTSLSMDGKKVYGKAEILDNQPYGRCLRGLFERKTRVGISSRGVGDMEMYEAANNKQCYRVMPGYTYVTWDCVAEPSVRGAILNIQEGVQKKVRREHREGR